METFESEVRAKLVAMNVTLTPCKFCNEEVIFLMINKINPAMQKNWIIPFGMDLEPHRDKCRAKMGGDNPGGFSRRDFRGNKNNRGGSPEDNW